MFDLVNPNKAKFLTDQIKDVEWQVLKHQQMIDFRSSVLVRKICQQLTEPSSLLLAGGIGFIMGEITKRRQTAKIRAGSIDKAASTSPLKVALTLLSSARALYTALPLAWLMRSRYQPGASNRASKRKRHPEPMSRALYDRRKSRYDKRLQPTR